MSVTPNATNALCTSSILGNVKVRASMARGAVRKVGGLFDSDSVLVTPEFLITQEGLCIGRIFAEG